MSADTTQGSTPPGGYTTRVCRHCWTSIQWTGAAWTHSEGAEHRDVTHTPEPPRLPAAPSA